MTCAAPVNSLDADERRVSHLLPDTRSEGRRSTRPGACGEKVIPDEAMCKDRPLTTDKSCPAII